ncbi:MAG TPA: hypothetical protein DGG94_05665 [Micromonosporaceae bacterium]|nr:hypothetical protein [Micromonosporaceae bacterium]HCU49287.1 hypothetical protein [Micromonosporaceae bacterium]
MPSGSAKTTQPVPSGLRRSSTMEPPRPSTRSTAMSRRSSGVRQMCTRFFTVLGSGTCAK